MLLSLIVLSTYPPFGSNWHDQDHQRRGYNWDHEGMLSIVGKGEAEAEAVGGGLDFDYSATKPLSTIRTKRW
jgi:hypothetical protein